MLDKVVLTTPSSKCVDSQSVYYMVVKLTIVQIIMRFTASNVTKHKYLIRACAQRSDYIRVLQGRGHFHRL